MKLRMQDTAEWTVMLQAAQVLYLLLQLPQQHVPMVHSITLQMQELLRGQQVIERLTTLYQLVIYWKFVGIHRGTGCNLILQRHK